MEGCWSFEITDFRIETEEVHVKSQILLVTSKSQQLIIEDLMNKINNPFKHGFMVTSYYLQFFYVQSCFPVIKFDQAPQ